MSKALYNLIYHAGIPGRAEFIRLYFEATSTPYTDSAREVGQECIAPYSKDGFEHCDKNPTPFAPPILLHNDLVISQTPNILLYLSSRIGPLDLGDGAAASKVASLDDPSTFHHQANLLTILDLNNEAHDTHHPTDVGLYYEDQKDAAVAKAKAFREGRVPKFLSWAEGNIAKSGSGYLTKEASYADLALFQVVDGLHYAFPKLIAKIKGNYPKVLSLHERVKSSPKISAYLASDRRQPFNQYGVYRHYPELDEA